MTAGDDLDGQPRRPIRVALPGQLRSLAGVEGELTVEVAAPVTLETVFDAIEAHWPQLRGTMRDQTTGRRRAMIRLFADGQDVSDVGAHQVLPAAVVDGKQPLRVVGAIAGG